MEVGSVQFVSLDILSELFALFEGSSGLSEFEFVLVLFERVVLGPALEGIVVGVDFIELFTKLWRSWRHNSVDGFLYAEPVGSVERLSDNVISKVGVLAGVGETVVLEF